MIAHSGFTRSHLPGSFQEWITKNGDKPLSAFKMTPNYSQSSAPAPADPAHLVPIAMHLDHLQITAKAERSFGFKLGFFAGMLLTLIGTYLHYRHG